MAKQIGPMKITGTLGDLTFYELNGQYYVKSTSRISKKRIRYDPSFARLRRAQQRFKKASLLVKSVYYSIPREKRLHGLYAQLVAQALPLVKQEVADEEIVKIIMRPFFQNTQKQTMPKGLDQISADDDAKSSRPKAEAIFCVEPGVTEPASTRIEQPVAFGQKTQHRDSGACEVAGPKAIGGEYRDKPKTSKRDAAFCVEPGAFSKRRTIRLLARLGEAKEKQYSALSLRRFSGTSRVLDSGKRDQVKQSKSAFHAGFGKAEWRGQVKQGSKQEIDSG